MRNYFIIAFVCLACCSCAAAWDVASDTWTATDALGRSLPDYEECGPPREDRFVGVFYFIWLGQHGTGGPFDISRILAAGGEPQWGPPGAFHHWGEPELGYYLSDDEWVIRRHCSMLTDAGVDVLIFDVTNAFTYDAVYLKLCEVLTRIRAEGGAVPQVCFLTNASGDVVVRKLYDRFYSRNLYPELWFRWQGKPLILVDPTNLDDELKSFFTIRRSWAWSHPGGWFGDGKDRWPWLDGTPQAFGWHEPGVPEQMPVCVAQHPTTNIGRSHSKGIQPPPDQFRSDEGIYFAEQWEHALEVDPQFIFITGWNEWVAQRFLSDGTNTLAGRTLEEGETFFVDQYSQEYSRDIEPMRGGHTDNYYYLMVAGIRRFKGVRPPPHVGPPVDISIDGDFSDWHSVGPEFRDTLGDTMHRRHQGWGSAGAYVNTTGRNDVVLCKVARSAVNVYFYARTRDCLTSSRGGRWMLLFIDADSDSGTGWNGYDLLVNEPVISDTLTTVRRWIDGAWKPAARAEYRTRGCELEVAVPNRVLGLRANQQPALDFHWADNMGPVDDITGFFTRGDSAPNRRFNYRYRPREVQEAALADDQPSQ